MVSVHGHKRSLLFLFDVEVHPGSQEYGQHHPSAQTVQPLSISHCPDQLEVCRRPAEGMPQQGELRLLLPWQQKGDHCLVPSTPFLVKKCVCVCV